MRLAAMFTMLSLHAATYKVQGLVLEVDRAQGIVLVSHREVPGYMPAMTMPFHADPPSQLDGLQPGARIEFELSGRARAKRIRLAESAPVAKDEFVMPKAVNALQVGQQVPDFELVDHSGKVFRFRDLAGQTVVVNFIYTRCPLPDVCPRLAANSAYLQSKLGGRVQLLTITLDPTYDTPMVLAAYAKRWKADAAYWRFLTGPEGVIQNVTGMFGVVFWPEEGAITHTSSTAVIGADGTLKALVAGSSFRASELKDLVEKHLR